MSSHDEIGSKIRITMVDGLEKLKDEGFRVVKSRFADTPIGEYLRQIDDIALRYSLNDMHTRNPFFNEVCAGAKHHHWWKGGLADHVREMIGIGLDLKNLYSGDMGAISKDDIIAVCFLHDFAKIHTYRYITEEDRAAKPDKFKPAQVFTYVEGAQAILDHEGLLQYELIRNGVPLSKPQYSAILFHEGGFSDSNFGFGGVTGTSDTVMHANPLVPFIHMLDLYSSQILGKSLV